MFDFERIVRKLLKAVRARTNFLKGAIDALLHLHNWAEHQKAKMEQMEALSKDLFEGDDSRRVWLVVGSALTCWASMEEVMVTILAQLLRTRLDKAGLILYSTINFSVWISIIDELFAIDDVHFTLKPRWNKLADRLRRLKNDRDRIAHHAVHPKSPNGSIFAESTLRPSEFDIRQKSLKYKPMSNDDINVFTHKVFSLAKDLLSLAKEMTDLTTASPNISPEQGRDPPRLDSR